MSGRPRVVITQRAFPETIDLLSPHAEVFVDTPARDADALMVFMPDSLDEEFLRACPNLKIVAAALKGCDNFDVEACTRLGIWFTIVPDLLTEPTAELALALMLGLARNVMAGDRLIRSGKFQGWRPILYGTGLAGSTVGIIGYGAVGRALARMLQGFSCRVQYYRSDGGWIDAAGNAARNQRFRGPASAFDAGNAASARSRGIEPHEARRLSDQREPRIGGRRRSHR